MIVGYRWLLVSEVCGEPQNTRTAGDVLLCPQVVHLDVEFTFFPRECGLGLLLPSLIQFYRKNGTLTPAHGAVAAAGAGCEF
jgi:hypothetical protein